MSQWVKAPATKTDSLRWVQGTHVEGKTKLPPVVQRLLVCSHPHARPHTAIKMEPVFQVRRNNYPQAVLP